MISFENYILNEQVIQTSLSEFESMIISNQYDDYLVHFSNSNIFPPERSGISSYNNINGGHVGASVYIPKLGLFMWRLGDIKDKIKKILKSDVYAGISGLYSLRKYLYLAKIQSRKILYFSKYSDLDLKKDVQKLKDLGYSFAFSKTDIKNDILMKFEFENPEMAIQIKNITGLFDIVEYLYNMKGKSFRDLYFEKLIPNDSRKIKFRILPESIKNILLVNFAVRDGVLKVSNVVFNHEEVDSTSRKFLEAFGFDDFRKIDFIQTLNNIRNSIQSDIENSRMIKITPEEYIAAFSNFIKTNSKIDVSNHPALRIWLTVMFFGATQDSSWKDIWTQLGYDALVDDDETFQVIPGLEKVISNNPGYGRESYIISRLDNEGNQYVILDFSIFREVHRISLDTLYPKHRLTSS